MSKGDNRRLLLAVDCLIAFSAEFDGAYGARIPPIRHDCKLEAQHKALFGSQAGLFQVEWCRMAAADIEALDCPGVTSCITP